jgi:cytochrome c-type biogenesis protein CcmH
MMQTRIFRWVPVCIALLGMGNALANEAMSMASDPLAEKRMVAISEELRCLVCQNESLAGSRAELAQDLRREIHVLIKEGKTDAEIMDFMVNRYGDYVRYRPPMKATTWLLWFGPFLLLLGGLGSLIHHLRQRTKAAESLADNDSAPLTTEQQHQADALLNTTAGKEGTSS